MKNNIIIVGLWKTGFCVLDYFVNQDVNIQVFDSKTDYDSDKIAKLSSNKNVIFNLGRILLELKKLIWSCLLEFRLT